MSEPPTASISVALPASSIEGTSIGQAVRELAAPVDPDQARTQRPKAPPPSTKSLAAHRYRATLEAYQTLADGEDSDSDEDRDDDRGAAQGSALVHVLGSAGARIGERGHVLIVEAPEDQSDASTTVSPDSALPAAPTPHPRQSSLLVHQERSGAHNYADNYVDMSDDTAERGQHHRAGPPTGPIPEEGTVLGVGPGVFTHVHSPASETDPSQEPYWHDTSPVSAGPAQGKDEHGLPEPMVDSETESDGFTLEKVVPPTNGYNLNYCE
ncbi:unnamed protein product [Phytophthora fragariaefolia]|uniref:Unnamed protein product n=1 Tax=Phytophthora fragariaefolia TaxID=1490495 RepID=A0A9W6XWS6_9STRA|nr:unnamed protein product [Phytophthora fragariaefolia]